MKKKHTVDVYGYIYGQITTGKLSMGSPISEMEIAETLGISRSPVREALKKLEGEGIVTRYANKGTFVTMLTIQDIGELYDLRAVLEVFAVEKAVRNLDQNELSEVEQCFQNLNSDSPVSEYHRANQWLHAMLIRASGSRHLQEIYNILNAQINILNVLSTDKAEDFVDSRGEHLQIIHGLQEGNVEKTQIHIKEHIEKRKNNAIKQFVNNWNKHL